MKDYRIEKDTMGDVKVPIDVYWGAQTQRSIQNFKIGDKVSMPIEVIHAFAYLKKAAAFANYDSGVLELEKKELITKVCDEIIEGKHNDQFPLVVWQTGSGTQTNMNLNEVISNRAHILQDKKNKLSQSNRYLHPNDDVNKSQSSNDTFPTAMSICSYKVILEKTIPAILDLLDVIKQKSKEFDDVIKIGRTHFMDATPLTLGQEFSGYASQLEHGVNALKNTMEHLSELAIGATAVGTGINAPNGYSDLVVRYLNEFTGLNFKTAVNKFEALSANDAFVGTHSAIKQIAVSLMKIANDIRMLSSGPRSGIGEIIIPSNEPGSSIMPGKVNPTQSEAMTMVCAQVMGNDVAISIAGSNGHFQLNVFRPVIIHNFLQSAKLIADTCISFRNNCFVGIKPNYSKIESNLNNSLMLVTALNRHIGYDNAAKIAKSAYNNGTSLKQEAVKLGFLSEDEFDKLVKPEEMIGR